MHGNSIYDKNLTNLNNVIINNFNFLKNESCYSNIRPYNLILHNNIQPNIGAMLIHNIYSFNFYLCNYKYFKCQDSNCKICFYSSNSNTIKINNNFTLPILSSSSCNSTGIIYIIFCKLCKIYYIGQSKRSVKERLNEHFYKINNHVPFDNCTTVSNHFNLLLHDLSYLKFFIYTVDLHDDKERQHLENKLIFLFKNIFNVKLINNVFPCPYNYYKSHVK